MAPFVLKFKGNKSFSPLSQISDADTLTRTWKVCTKVAAHLEQGQRLENLSWRLWFLQIALVQSDNAKQKREFKKFSKGMGEKLDKDKGRSITELQAPNFKRTDSTDKVRLKVEEMAHHREAGTSPAHLLGPAASSAREANHMKGMQYTFAVDPRVKPLTTAPATEGGAGGGGNGGGAGVSGKPAGAGGMMGKMRVKPVMMGPPPVPVRHQQQQSQSQSSQSNAQQQQQQRKEDGGKDGGDVTMHGGNMNTMDAATTGSGLNKGGDHAMMDVSEDHASLYGLSKEDMGLGEMANDAMNGIEDEEGTGHHTPTPHPHRLLPSHHPSALPYPPPPSTGPAAHALSNAFTSNTSSIGSNNSNSGSNAGGYGRNAQQQAPNIIRFPTIFTSDFGPTSLLCALPTSGAPSFSFENLMASNNNMYQSFAALVDTGGAPTTTQQSVTTQGIYGPNSPPTSAASLTRSNGGAGGGGAGVFSSGAMSSSTGAGGSTHFSANGATNPYGAGASQQHVYHPQQQAAAAAAANSAFGIGIGMQTAGTGFDFGVPRPTFEFPIEEILKGEGDGGLDEYDASILAGVGVGVGAAGAGAAGHSSTTATGNGTNTAGTNAGGSGGGSDADTLITPWDANNVNVNMSLAADAFGMGFGSSLSGMAAAAWGVQPAEIHSPTTTTTSGNPLTNANVASVGGMTSPQSPTRRSFHGSNSGSNARGGGGMTSPNLGYGAQPQQPQQQPQQQQQQQQQPQQQGQLQHQRRTSSASPPSVHLTTSMGAGANAAMVNNNDMYDASGASSGQNVLGGQQAQSPQPMSATTPSALSNSTPGASATPGSTTGTTATSSSLNSSLVGGATSSVLGGSSGGPGSVVSPGSASGGAGSVVPGNVGNTAPGGVKSECANCGATHTPLWRRGLNDELNCNACGLYCKLHKRARPKNLRTSHGDRAGNAWGAKTGEAEVAGEPVQCHNCATMATPLWRKDDEGNTLCNACGLYLKLHGTRRPLSMKSDVIRKRSRHETEKRTSVSSIITVMNSGNTNTQNSRRNSPTPPPSAGSSSSGPEPLANGPNGLDSLGFPFEQEFSYGNEPDYLSTIGLGDLNSFSTFGSYVYYGDNNASSSSLTNRNGLASPRSPTEVQHIVETTVMTGVENGGGHMAPNAKRRRMTIESSFSGSSMAQTTGGANSAHSSPTGLGQKGPNTSPPFFSLDATLNNVNNAGGSYNEPSGSASPTRSASANTSSPSMTGVAYDFYGYPIHPPMVPLHPPSLMHPHSMMWSESNNTPTQSSMHRRARSHSHSHSPSHSRTPSNAHSRSNSQHITMPVYLYDGGASSRAYEGGNSVTPTGMMNAGSNGGQTEEELFNSGFGMYTDHPSMEETRMHYGPSGL